jgi:hypothetical protein
MKARIFSFSSDFIGFISSGFCLIHCALMPFLLAAQSFHQFHEFDEAYHLDYFFLAICGLAVWFSTRHVHHPALLLAFRSCFVAFAGAILLNHRVEGIEYLGYAASIGLMVTHVLNFRYCRHTLSHAMDKSVGRAS